MTMRLRAKLLMASSVAIAGSAGALALALSATPSNAATLEVGWASNLSPTVTVVGGLSSSGVDNQGQTNNGITWSADSQGLGVVVAPELLSATNISTEVYGAVSGVIASVFYVYVTETGLTTPTPGFLSTFAINTITGGSYTTSTYYSASNTAFATTTPLSSFTTTSAPTGDSAESSQAGSGTYSVTEVFAFTDTGVVGDSVTGTIDIFATPLPGTLPLFASGLVGFWAWNRRRGNGKDSALLESAAA
jgi:hypothetical protein